MHNSKSVMLKRIEERCLSAFYGNSILRALADRNLLIPETFLPQSFFALKHEEFRGLKAYFSLPRLSLTPFSL